ncbi:MAG: DsbA family oxidoreductase [Chloroflexota bacterium]
MTNLTFYFDPRCPFAWQTSLWARTVQAQGAIAIHWKLFSLNEQNRDAAAPPTEPRQADAALRALWLAREESGEAGIDRLYLALGRARHDRRENLADHEVVKRAIQEAELDSALLDRALGDDAVNAAVLAEHQDAVDRLDAFGVPWLVLEDRDFGFFGPVIKDLPDPKEALELWEHTSWMLGYANFYELKRSR